MEVSELQFLHILVKVLEKYKNLQTWESPKVGYIHIFMTVRQFHRSWTGGKTEKILGKYH